MVFQSDELPEIAFDPVGSLEDEQLTTDLHTKLNEALNKLPGEHRKIFLQGFTC